jgi:predicted MFS family arabinose efflux permease
MSHYKKFRSYAIFLFATLIAAIGGGFIQVVVYNQIANLNLPPFYFGLAFSCAVFPALLGSQIGKIISEKENYNKYLFFSQLFAVFMILLIKFIVENNLKFILLGEFVTSFAGSIAYPILQKLIKLTFEPEKLPIAAKVDAYAYGANIILGLGFGAVLSAFIGFEAMWFIAAILYVISAILFYFSRSKNMTLEKNLQLTQVFWKRAFTSRQKLAFILMPTLIIIGTPPTSLLPSIYNHFPTNEVSNFIISPVMTLILFRSIGQFIGPMLINNDRFEAFASNKQIISLCLLFFIATYSLIFHTDSYYLALFLIVVAHVASNVVFTLATYSMLASFSTEEIAQVSATQYQINQIVITLTAILGGVMANFLGGQLTIILFALIGLGFFAIIGQNERKFVN